MRSFFSNGLRRQSVPAAPVPAPAQPSQPQPVQRRPPRPPPRLSDFSTAAVQNSAWSSIDFMLGAGMVIIQPSTHKIVVIHETEKQYWFLPRGRKDVGESLEQAALREAYEESGYRAEFLPLLNPTHQPVPPGNRANSDWLNTEPIYMTLTSWQPRKRRNGTIGAYGGEYVTMWYVGQIPEDMTPDEGTGMADEQNYQSYLLTVEEAMSRLWDSEKLVVAYTWRIFLNTELEKSKMAAESGAGTSAGQGLL